MNEIKKLKLLQKLCYEKNILLTFLGKGHYQIKGPLLVNYYPFSTDSTAYVSGTKAGFKNCNPEKAVSMCFEAPVANGKTDKRGSYRKVRRSMIRNGKNSCHWCGSVLTLNDSTLEHVIPLSRGGLDNRNNMTLACKSCNESRGSEIPELKSNK